jgi:hypothetical protein
MTDGVKVTFSCDLCGARIGWPDDAVDSTGITCQKCNQDCGTYGDLRAKAMEAAKAKIRAEIKKVSKRR